jgi:hypothetical protein
VFVAPATMQPTNCPPPAKEKNVGTYGFYFWS